MRSSALVFALFLVACEKKPDATTEPAVVTTAAATTTTPPPTASAAPAATSATATVTAVASAAPAQAATTTATATTAAKTAGKDAGGPAPVALKPASGKVTGNNFALDLASPGCRAGEECAMTIRLLPQGDYHVNKEYPYKFTAQPAANVAFLGKSDANVFGRTSGDFVEQGEKAAVLTVRFKPAAAGDARVAGKYKLSVCSADKCQIDEANVDLSVPVL